MKEPSSKLSPHRATQSAVQLALCQRSDNRFLGVSIKYCSAKPLEENKKTIKIMSRKYLLHSHSRRVHKLIDDISSHLHLRITQKRAQNGKQPRTFSSHMTFSHLSRPPQAPRPPPSQLQSRARVRPDQIEASQVQRSLPGQSARKSRRQRASRKR